jgi:hypothetical protein
MKIDRGYVAAFAICSLATVFLLWSVKYLPMTDLPQHAAQIAIWRDYHDPRFGYDSLFEIHYFTPYLLGYSFARAFATFLSIRIALKVVITLAVIATPLALDRVLRVLGTDPRFSLIGFPVAVGYPFVWGFFNYVVALPVGLFFLAYGLAYAREPTRRRAVVLAMFALLLFWAHGMVFLVCVGAVSLAVMASAGGLRAALTRLLPIAGAALVVVAWSMLVRERNSSPVPNVLQYGFQRLLLIAPLSVGYGRDSFASAIGWTIFVLLGLAGMRPARTAWRLLPLAWCLLLFLALPRNAFNVAILYPRVAVFILPFVLVAFEQKKPVLRPALFNLLLPAVIVGWLGFQSVRFHAFDDDARGYDELLEKMEPGKRMRGLVFDQGTDVFGDGVPLLHHPVWYQSEKGGHVAFSFAQSNISLVSYRPDKRPNVNAEIDWRPDLFDPNRETREYDYFVVHARDPIGHALFARRPEGVEFGGRSGDWWVYRRIGPEPTK